MDEETTFLSTIRQTPADDTARLVYADWLDEQGDPITKSKADFIRLELQMSVAPEQGLNRIRWLNQLQKLAATLDPEWLSLVSHPKLEACRLAFQFECPQQWNRLTPGDTPNVRFCESCKRNVHYCDTLDEARDHAARGDCVAVTLALIRRPCDLYPPPRPGLPRWRLARTPSPPVQLPRTPQPRTVGTPIQLTSEMIERLGRPRGPIAPPDSPVVIDPVPPKPMEEPMRELRLPRKKSKKSRRRTRNVERDNWEELE